MLRKPHDIPFEMLHNVPPLIAVVVRDMSLIELGFVYAGSEDTTYWFQYKHEDYDATVNVFNDPGKLCVQLDIYDERLEASVVFNVKTRKELVLKLAEWKFCPEALTLAREYKINALLE